MMNRTRQNKQHGISIVLVLFLLVVVSGLVVSISQLSSTQNINSAYSARGAQAYFAARAGLDYAIARINAGTACGGIGGFTLDGYAISIGCTEVPAGPATYDEGNTASPYNIFVLNVRASRGGFSVPDAVNRRVRATIRFP